MLNQKLSECIQKAEECINISELLINLNSEQDAYQWEKRTQEAIQFYNSMIQTFEEFIQQCKLNDCEELIPISNEIISQCKNMINQCGATPSDIPSLTHQSKVEIIQNILPHAAKCIEICEKFLLILLSFFKN